MGGGEEPFDVVDDVERAEEGGEVEGGVVAVGDGEDDGVVAVGVGGGRGKVGEDVDAVFAAGYRGGCPRVMDVDGEVVLGEGAVYVDYLGVADVGAVFLEGEAEDEDAGVEYLDAFAEHEFYDLVGNVGAHGVVHPASGEDYFGVVAVALGALGEVVGVDTDAVSADESGTEGEEVPFRGCRLEHVHGVDAHEGEDL